MPIEALSYFVPHLLDTAAVAVLALDDDLVRRVEIDTSVTSCGAVRMYPRIASPQYLPGEHLERLAWVRTSDALVELTGDKAGYLHRTVL